MRLAGCQPPDRLSGRRFGARRARSRPAGRQTWRLNFSAISGRAMRAHFLRPRLCLGRAARTRLTRAGKNANCSGAGCHLEASAVGRPPAAGRQPPARPASSKSTHSDSGRHRDGAAREPARPSSKTAPLSTWAASRLGPRSLLRNVPELTSVSGGRGAARCCGKLIFELRAGHCFAVWRRLAVAGPVIVVRVARRPSANLGSFACPSAGRAAPAPPKNKIRRVRPARLMRANGANELASRRRRPPNARRPPNGPQRRPP